MTDLIPVYRLGGLTLTDYPYAVEFGGNHGAPETVVELISTLTDGEDERVSRHGNRELSLVIHVEGADHGDVTLNEAALRRECATKGVTLEFESGDDFAPTTVFELTSAEMDHARDEAQESANLRRWELTLRAKPFGRSLNPTVAEPLPTPAAAPNVVTVDSCTSATGWKASANGVDRVVDMTREAGAVSVVNASPDTSTALVLSRAGFIDLTSTQFLVVEANAGSLLLDTTGKGVSGLSAPVSVRSIQSGWSEFTFYVGKSVSYLFFARLGWVTDLRIRNVSRSDAGAGHSPRQLTRIIPVGGTERTAGSLEIASANGTDPLSLVIAHTCPTDGAGDPPLRRWRTAGNVVTPSASTYSGATEPLFPEWFYAEEPVEALPTGTYQLMMAAYSTVAGTFDVEVTVKSSLGGATLGARDRLIATGNPVRARFPIANSLDLIPLGVVKLPVVRQTSGSIVFGIRTPGTSTVHMDEAWAFRVDGNAGLSVFSTNEPRAWLDSPGSGAASDAVPTLWVGSAEDRSDAHYPTGPGFYTVFAKGSHEFVPPEMTTFAAVRGTDWPKIRLSYHKRWHSNAAED